MPKPAFITFDLRPQDYINLAAPDTKHLLNHTEAWLDEKMQEVQTEDKFQIIGCTMWLYSYVYTINQYFPFGHLITYMDKAFIVVKFLWLLSYGALFAAVFSINLFVRRFLAYINTPTK